MTNYIKQILREEIQKNILGVIVTKPNQELIILRGIPGSGKSTKAKQLVKNGIIHSTDDIIEKSGDYHEFFNKMIKNNDFSPLTQMHKQNLTNAINSMKQGITPVIIDNTNIKSFEVKPYVIAALEMGFADSNIKFVDIGTNGLDAQTLANRNMHGVPLEKIEMMIKNYNKQGKISLNSLFENKNEILYSAVVLDDKSHNKLLSHSYPIDIPYNWKKIAHHMTIVFGKGLDNKDQIGKKVILTVTHIGISDMAIAVKVSGYMSNNKTPHVTIAINPDGGKAVMSNDITNWIQIKPFTITGYVQEIKK